MKKVRLILVAAIVVVALVAMAMLGGCKSEVSFADQGQVNIAKNAPVLKVATNAEFPPFEFMKSGKFDGYDIAMINAIGTKLGMKVEIHNMEFDAIVTAVQTSGFDVAVAGMTVTPERLLQVDFSSSYFVSSQVIVVKKDVTKYDGMTKELIDAALVGVKLHVASGQIGHYYAEGGGAFEFPGISGAKDNRLIAKYTSVSLAAQGIKGEEVAFFDKDVAINFVANNTNFKMVSTPLTEEEYAIAINKSKTDLKEKINKALAELIEDGTIAKIKAHYQLV